MRLDGDLGHLTYCTNIHAGETWPEVRASLERHLPAIKAQLTDGRPLGVGLRLSAVAAETLHQPASLEPFREWLAANQLYVYTLNGFPYGPFHGTRVKEDVYQPDWQHEVRLTYTNQLADLLARLLPDDPDLDGSISTVPGTFKPLAEAPGVAERMADLLIRHVAHLVEIERRAGRTIALALEPEPYCFLETIDETVRFFEAHLFGRQAAARLTELAGLDGRRAEEALRRHIGVCYDVCHAAVEFENPAASLEALRRAGIGIPKLQLSAALRVTGVGASTAEQLAPFDEPVYLHQVIERQGDHLRRFLDLPEALAALGAGEGFGSEWRIHFHVPIFLGELQHFSTTQDFLREILALHRERPISPHLEVETYTWDVLPERYRQVDIGTAIARELAWVEQQLRA